MNEMALKCSEEVEISTFAAVQIPSVEEDQLGKAQEQLVNVVRLNFHLQ